jgi:hypothetical protein
MPQVDTEVQVPSAGPHSSDPPPARASAKKWHIKLGPVPAVPRAVPQVTTAEKESGVDSEKTAEKATEDALSVKPDLVAQYRDFRAILENPEIKELPGLNREQIRRLRDWIDEYRTRALNADVLASKSVATQSPQSAGGSQDSRLEFLTAEQHRALLRLLSKSESAEDPATPDKRPVEAAAE